MDVSKLMFSPSGVRRSSSETPALSSATVGAAMLAIVGTNETLMFPSSSMSAIVAMSVLLLVAGGGSRLRVDPTVSGQDDVVGEERHRGLRDFELLPFGASEGHAVIGHFGPLSVCRRK